MKRKIWSIRLVKLVIFLLLAFGLFSVLTRVLAHKESAEKYLPFYEAQENFDVLFFGTSHGANGFSPMELWRGYGIASYNLSQHSEYPAVTYWKVREALEYTTPSLIVLDCYLGGAPDKIPAREDWGYVHKSLDAMPFSLLKVQAVMDLLPANKDRAEFLWNFVMYHNRYDQISKDDFAVSYSLEKGSESRIGVLPLNAPELIPETQADDAASLNSIVSIQYYRKILELCQEKGIDVLFAYLPYYTDEASQRGANTMGEWCRENNAAFVNLLYEEDLIDYQTDLYDYGHLNPAGYVKVNRFLGSYITEHYSVPDRREDPAYFHWNEEYFLYAWELSNSLKETQDIFTYLMMLQNPNLSYTLYIPPDAGLLSNPYLEAFLRRAGVDVDFNDPDVEKHSLFLIADKQADTVQQYTDTLEAEAETSFGQVSLSCKEEVILEFRIGGFSHTGYTYEKKIYFNVTNAMTGESVDFASFSLSDGFTRLEEAVANE